MASPQPSTLSYAVLGLLAIRPFTANELKVQAERSLDWLWRRSERALYAEPKRLVALGWATTTERTLGRRSVPEYHITPEGHQAVRDWLTTPPALPTTEAEVALRVMFADLGDLDDLRQALLATRRQLAVNVRDQTLDQYGDYLETGGPYPERLHLIALIADFMRRYTDMLDEWTTASLKEIENWSSTQGLGMTDSARQLLTQAIKDVEQYDTTRKHRQSRSSSPEASGSSAPTPTTSRTRR
jgi:DNA-binding PadR family transcriptional regulator